MCFRTLHPYLENILVCVLENLLNAAHKPEYQNPCLSLWVCIMPILWVCNAYLAILHVHVGWQLNSWSLQPMRKERPGEMDSHPQVDIDTNTTQHNTNLIFFFQVGLEPMVYFVWEEWSTSWATKAAQLVWKEEQESQQLICYENDGRPFTRS